jgi:AcrR family transcriptional regulator
MPKARDLTTSGRREQILDEALRLFAAHGAQNVTTRHIAKAVGISQPSLYAHFPSRDAIAVELCCRAFEDLYNRLAAASLEAGESSLARLRAMVRTYVDFGLSNSSAYRIAFMTELPAETTPEKSEILAAGVRAFSVLRGLFGSPGATELEADAAAQSTWASLHGLVALLIARREFPWVDLDRLVDLHLEKVCEASACSLNIASENYK